MTGPRRIAAAVSPRNALRGLAAMLLVGAAAVGIWQAAAPRPASIQEQVADVTQTLRCPSCEGQSVAASQSDMARQMQQVTALQLAEGRTPAQVRAWFVERYGPGVQLDPPLHGIGLIAHLLPFALLVVGGVLVARRIGHRRGVAVGAVLVCGLGAGLLATSPFGAGVAPRETAAPDWSPRALQDPLAATPTPPRTPVSAAPSPTQPGAGTPDVSGSATAGSSQALSALRDGRSAEAAALARRQLDSAEPGSRDWQDALLVLGLSQSQQGDAAAAQTLHTFLSAAPGHPAATMVRRLLDGG